MRAGPPCFRKQGEMSSGPSAVLVLMCLHASVTSCCVNGSETDCDGSRIELMVSRTVLSCDLLNLGSSGSVETDWKCCASMLRFSLGVVGNAVLAFGLKVGSGVDVDGVVRCHAVQMM